MSKKKKYIPLSFLLIFAIYCSVTIGQSFDEQSHLALGKITLDYLFSLGEINKDTAYREYYAPIYWSILYFITELFPPKFQIEVSHLVNLAFSVSTIFGIRQISKELFNKEVGDIVFVILFFFPVFFGHMSINSKDTILAFSHIWMVYLILRYLKNQNIKKKTNIYIIKLGTLAAISTGIQLIFLGSQIPVILFALIEIFFIKKIINRNFSKKKFLYDLIKCFLIFYFLLILFWIDVHGNIFLYPINILREFFSVNFVTGWSYNLINGKYFLSSQVPSSYFLINFIYKSPEFVLATYFIFLIIIFTSINYYKSNFSFFNYKLFFLVLIMLFPSVILYFIPFQVYDGMRLFLWTLPYFCIIPALTIYYLKENLKSLKIKVTFFFLSLFFVYHLYNFFSFTPYQYTYLNFLNGDHSNRYQKFENDYWGTSVQELITKSQFNSDKVIKLATCGVVGGVSKEFFKKKSNLKHQFVSPEKADYIIMINRVTKNGDEMINCFDKYKGKNIATVKKRGLILSVIRKINIE